MTSGEEQLVLNEQEDEKIEQIVKREVVAEIRKSEFSGPIPPPSIIKGYEEVLPGAADRILSMAEEQAKHRQAMERKIVNTESRDSLLGILFAFSLGIGCIVAAIIVVIMVPQNSGAIAGSVFGVAGIGSIIATFIRGTRRSSSNDKADKNKQQRESEEN